MNIYRTRAISGCDLYCFKAGFLLDFPLKNKTKAYPSYENKQGACSISERPEMVRVRYVKPQMAIYPFTILYAIGIIFIKKLCTLDFCGYASKASVSFDLISILSFE